MWFQDHQTVLVYHPGSGGEYICCRLNGQKELSDKNNKHRCFNNFPGSERLYEESIELPAVDFEWAEECRLTFNSEDEYKDKVTSHQGWQFTSGNPDRIKPRLGQRTLMENCNHFPTHWCYGLFREPVFKWLDCDNDYWLAHWDLVLDIKDRYFEKELQESKGKWTHYEAASLDYYSFQQRYKRYRQYYTDKFPNSRITVESLFDKVDYISWGKRNLAVCKSYLDKHSISSKHIDKIYDGFLTS